MTGSMDQELRVWKLNWTADVKDEEKLSRQLEIVKLEETDNLEDSSVSKLKCLIFFKPIKPGLNMLLSIMFQPMF